LLALDETAPEECGLAAKGELIHYWEEGVYGHVVWTPREMYALTLSPLALVLALALALTLT
jgi:hypothetical protein